MARNSASTSSQMAAAVKKVSTRHSALCTGFFSVMTPSAAASSTSANA
jgi:hypothetical protein